MFFLYGEIRKLLFIFEKRLIVFLPLLTLFLISSFLDLISLGLIAPYISFLINPEIIHSTKFGEFFSFQFTELNRNKFFIYFSLLLILIFALKTFFAILIRALISRFVLKNLANLQVRLISAYQNMNYSDFILRNSSEYIRNVKELSGDCKTCLEAGLRIISECIVLIAIIIYLLTIQFQALIVLVFIISISLILYNYYFKPKAVKYGKRKVDASKLIYQGVDEGIKGFKEIRLLAKQEFFNNLVKRGAEEIFKNEFKTNLILTSPRYFLELVIVIFVIAFLVLYILFGNQEINILPIVGVFAVAGLRILPGTTVIANGLVMVSYTYSAINIVYSDLKKISKIKKIDENIQNLKIEEKFQSVKLENINFKYPNSKRFVFKNLSFSLNNKDFIGIVGENGSGKTTIIDILLGLLQPQSGKVLINNKELNLKSFLWSQRIAYLPQEYLILDNTIKNNITLSNDFEKLDESKIKESIKQANLDEFINNLPDGINTPIGEKGIRLSGGQYKKICLARLFYHERDILIMDEATTSLDKSAENFIINEIRQLKGKKTIVIVTHHLNTLKYCDKIYKIENQKIVEKVSLN